MWATVLIALLSAGMTLGTLRLPERPAAGQDAQGEIVSGVGSASGALAVAKLPRTHARHHAAKVGPFTLPTAAPLRGPSVRRVLIGFSIPEHTGRAPTRTRGARGPPSSPFV